MEDIENEITCSYKEVLTIISLLSKDDWDKIPKERKNFYFKNMNKNYNFNFDISKTLDMQPLLPYTRVILKDIFTKYLATSEEKEEILKEESQEYFLIEEEKRKKYNPDDLFKKVETKVEKENTEELALVEYKESIFKRFFKKILNKFKLK